MAQEINEKSFDFAADVSKQLITLATGVITLTITFSEKIIESPSNSSNILMLLSWVCFGVSILFGIMTLMALTGILGKQSEGTLRPSIYTKSVTLPAIIQIIAFLIALVLSIWYGYNSVSTSESNPNKLEYPLIISNIKYQMRNCLPDSVSTRTIIIDQ